MPQYQGTGGTYTGPYIAYSMQIFAKKHPQMKGITLLWESKVFVCIFLIGLTSNKQEQIQAPFIALRL